MFPNRSASKLALLPGVVLGLTGCMSGTSGPDPDIAMAICLERAGLGRGAEVARELGGRRTAVTFDDFTFLTPAKLTAAQESQVKACYAQAMAQ